MLYFTPTRRLACSCVSVFEDKCWLLVFYTFASLPSRLGTGHIYNWVFQMGSRILARLLKSSYSIHCASNPISTVAIRCVQFKATRNAFSWHLQSITINYNQLQSAIITATIIINYLCCLFWIYSGMIYESCLPTRLKVVPSSWCISWTVRGRSPFVFLWLYAISDGKLLHWLPKGVTVSH